MRQACAKGVELAAFSQTPIDPAKIRSAIRTTGYDLVDGLVSPADVRAMRDFWLAEFSRTRPVAPLVWGPYLGERNGIIFDRRESHCLFRSFDYLWNPPYQPLTREVGLKLNRLRNAIVGQDDRCGELITEDRYGIYVTTSYYPPGEGWLWEHRDKMADRDHWHFIVPLTFRGRDFTRGGLILIDRAGNRVDVESLVSPGSVLFYDGTLPHSVERNECDPPHAVGRLQMFAIPVVFEPPDTADRLLRNVPLQRYARAKLSAMKQRLRNWVSV